MKCIKASCKDVTPRQADRPIFGKKSFYESSIFLNAASAWDFYAAGSLGFAIVKSRRDDGYDGDVNYYNRGRSLFMDVHLGVEYHINDRLGAFLDLSSGVSTIGIAIH